MINLFQFPKRSLAYPIIWMLLMILECVLSVNERHKHCAPSFSCGHKIDLYYPFWTSDREECGHPDFKVNCSDGFAGLTISSVKLRILEMNSKSRIIRLARMDYVNDLCPHNPENATLNHQVLPFSEDTEFLTFYYRCHLVPKVNFTFSGHIRQLDCEDDTDGQSFSVSSDLNSWNRDIINELKASCRTIVNVPVSRSALKLEERNTSVEATKKVLQKGFELSFNRDCSRCRESSGACGYDHTLGVFICYCRNKPHRYICEKKSLSRTTKIGSVAICYIMFKLFSLSFRKRDADTSNHPSDHKLKGLLPLKQYSYAEVKRFTRSFSHTVGKGGFGTVYGGNLCNGRKVAVKVLKDFKSNGEDFINEVASMSQTSHVNIVSLLGFCYEGSKRAIVYEFLENGSLDQFISKKKSLNLDVSTLYGIALGVARGLEYLHHGCKTRIVHFDIKPQNVLLDENLCPKVSDFGLAKLCEKRESILSLLDARGTIGYIAPEVFSRMYGRVSHKSDVYSYGMLVLEMMGARNKETVETHASNTSSTYFPDWIYKDLENDEHTWVIGDDTAYGKEIAKKMILVGLWCIQPCPSNRPSMNRVVEMMEGSLDAVEVPPKPCMQISNTLPPESLSEDNSNNFQELI